ncbi:hypothetical protein BC828DRAFT_375090 [Blastocladiella britannica]|nr:hypothetical protein BC828DRAFT_375090 [Blastocladiella britannica]
MTSATVVLMLHSMSLCLLTATGVKISRSFFLNATLATFWIVAGLTLFPLATTSATEIAYSRTSSAVWTPMDTAIGDIAVRLGYAGITACRLIRYQMIASKRKRRWAGGVLMVSNCLLLASTGVVVQYRVATFAYYTANTNKAAYTTYKQWGVYERWLSFVTFMVVQFVNLVADYLFFRKLVESTRAATRGSSSTQLDIGRIAASFAPTFVADLVVLVALVVDQLVYTSFSKSYSITIQRFNPTIELFLFLHITIPRTRSLLRTRYLSNNDRARLVNESGSTVAATATIGANDDLRSVTETRRESGPGVPVVFAAPRTGGGSLVSSKRGSVANPTTWYPPTARASVVSSTLVDGGGTALDPPPALGALPTADPAFGPSKTLQDAIRGMMPEAVLKSTKKQ